MSCMAQFTLDNITNGPVVAPREVAEAFDHFRSLPRLQAAEAMSTVLRGVTSGEGAH